MFKSVNLLRLNRGQEILSELARYCEKKGITSGIILGIIGSLEKVKFGTAPKDGKWGWDFDEFEGHLSILSGQGSLSVYEGEKIFHIHMCAIDPLKPGQLIGGHLEEGIVWATVEIYIGELSYQLERDVDPESGLTALRTT
ncbi:MAG: PPC domain-containing DNA-binding protein [Chloroflexota bacterium]|nr:DNA-binding protein [Chloroflexota bacterium]